MLTIDTDLAAKAKLRADTFRFGDEHTRTLEPAHALAAETLTLERTLSEMSVFREQVVGVRCDGTVGEDVVVGVRGDDAKLE